MATLEMGGRTDGDGGVRESLPCQGVPPDAMRGACPVCCRSKCKSSKARISFSSSTSPLTFVSDVSVFVECVAASGGLETSIWHALPLESSCAELTSSFLECSNRRLAFRGSGAQPTPWGDGRECRNWGAHCGVGMIVMHGKVGFCVEGLRFEEQAGVPGKTNSHLVLQSQFQRHCINRSTYFARERGAHWVSPGMAV